MHLRVDNIGKMILQKSNAHTVFDTNTSLQ